MTRGLLLTAVAFAILGGTAAGQAASPAPIVFSADRLPSLSGEIYRVDPNGHRVDLSRSPYQDFGPVVSPDGKRVAFFSDRSRTEGVYEVGVDGRGLVRVGRSVPLGPEGITYCCTDLAWQPHGGRLAVGATDGAWIVAPGRPSVNIRASVHVGDVDGWSPDGRALAVTDYRGRTPRERVVSPLGRTLWTVRNVTFPGATWSARGLLAVATEGRAGAREPFAVYDEAGHRQFGVRFGTDAQWSPNGRRIAYVSLGSRLQVRTETGRILLRKGPADHAWFSWAGNNHVVLAGYGSCRCEVWSLDVRTGKISPASDRWNDPRSPDGSLAVLEPPSGPGFAIQVAPTAGGPPRTYLQVPGCDRGGYWRGNAWFFQFVRRRSLVYGTWCLYPTADLYSVSLGGGALDQITNLQTNHTTPALSPDGTEIAYAWAQCTGEGCDDHSYSGPVEPPEPPSGIRVVQTDGSGERVLTNPGACTYDSTPAWSPDGSTILFSESGCAKASELYTVPAVGGPIHDLGVVGSDPAWGPSRVAYVGDKSDPGLWTANPDGSNRVKVAAAGSDPAWSSDGRLAYITRTAKSTTLVVGSTQRTLGFASVSSLAWSPDGTRLVLAARATPTGPSDVYTVKPDGTGLARLTTNYDASAAGW